MFRRKRGKSPFDLFDELLGFDEESLFSGETGEGGSGYSISVTYDQSGKPVVRVKTYGNIDEAELRRSLEEQYPGAKIEGLNKKPLVTFVDEKGESEKAEKKPREDKKTLIREID
jgi:hypothetical protein